MSSPAGELAEWAEEWDLVLRTGTVAEPTRVVYQRSIRQLRDYLAAHHPEITAPTQITPRHLQGWLRELTEAGRSEATRRVRLIAARLWFDYMRAEPDSGVTGNPAADLELPQPKPQPVPVIADVDLSTLLRTMAGSSFIDRRDTAAVRLLLDTGCRRAELVGIDVDDVDLRGQEVTLRRTKGGRGRIVPFGSKTALALRKYVRVRARHPAAGSAALFLSSRPDGVGDWRMRGGGLAEMLARRCEAAGLRSLNPHRFRHTWASDMLAHGAAEGDVEKLAGWRSPLMIRRYSAATADQRARDASRRLARGDRV